MLPNVIGRRQQKKTQNWAGTFFHIPLTNTLSLSLSLRARVNPKHEKSHYGITFLIHRGGKSLHSILGPRDPPSTLISVPNIYIYIYYYLNSWPHKEKREKKRRKKIHPINSHRSNAPLAPHTFFFYTFMLFIP